MGWHLKCQAVSGYHQILFCPLEVKKKAIKTEKERKRNNGREQITQENNFILKQATADQNSRNKIFAHKNRIFVGPLPLATCAQVISSFSEYFNKAKFIIIERRATRPKVKKNRKRRSSNFKAEKRNREKFEEGRTPCLKRPGEKQNFG